MTENLPQKGFRPYPPFDKPRPAPRVVLRSVSRRKKSRTPPRRRRHSDLDAFTAEAPWNQEQPASTTPFSLWPLPSTDPRPSPPEPPVAHSQLETCFPKPQRPARCVGRTPAGLPICFGYNDANRGCYNTSSCPKGHHICGFSGCFGQHPVYECPIAWQ